jgi:hypothetical protein
MPRFPNLNINAYKQPEFGESPSKKTRIRKEIKPWYDPWLRCPVSDAAS